MTGMVARALVVAGIAFALFAAWIWGFALPRAPEQVWVALDTSLDIKPWACVSAAPGAEPAFAGWFEMPGGGGPSAWHESLGVRLEAPTPFLREAVHFVRTGRGRPESVIGRYRFTGARRSVVGRPWGRDQRFE